jgi:hypothetical protein
MGFLRVPCDSYLYFLVASHSTELINYIEKLTEDEGTATAGAAASPNDPAPAPTSAAAGVGLPMAAESTPELQLPAGAAVETAATPTAQEIVRKFGFPDQSPGADNFFKSLCYFSGLQETVERRVTWNEIGDIWSSTFFSQRLHQTNLYLNQTLKEIFPQYRCAYLKILDINNRLVDVFGEEKTRGIYELLDKVSKTPGSCNSETLELIKKYGQNSHVVFRAFFDKVKELDITQENWDEKISLLPASDQPRVRHLILIETERQASFNRQPRILTLDRRDLSTLNNGPISKIESLCNDRLRIATRTSIFDLSSSEVKPSNPEFYQKTNQIRRIFADFRSQNFQDPTLMEDELQWRNVQVGKIEQEFKRFGR